MSFTLFIFLLLLLKTNCSTFQDCDPECIFGTVRLTSTNIGSFPKCAKVCSFLKIDHSSNLTHEQLTEAFVNLQTLVGGLEIVNTTFTDVKFLNSLTRIKANTSPVRISNNEKMIELGMVNLTAVITYNFAVSGNKEMTVLNLPKLQTVDCQMSPCKPVISMWNNNDDFCMTTEEMKVFLLNNRIEQFYVNSKICEPTGDNIKICTTPQVGSEELVGNLEIGPDFDTKTVNSLKIIYGSLLVQNSALDDLSCLRNLTHIAQFDGLKPVVEIQEGLKSIKMANLERIITSIWNAARIRNENVRKLENGTKTYDNFALFQKTPQNAPRSFDGLSLLKSDCSTYEDRGTFQDCEPECIFEPGEITSRNIGSFPKCAKVCSFLKIEGYAILGYDELTEAFKNMETLVGGLKIVDTDFTNVKFLKNLRRIEADTSSVEIHSNENMKELGMVNLTTVLTPEFQVSGNKEMTVLNLPTLQTVDCQIPPCKPVISINSNNDDFCMTTEEMKVFVMNHRIEQFYVRSKVCDPSAEDIKTCTTPEVGCEELVGNLEIGPNFDTKTVNSLKIIYGSLLVRNSTLDDLSCLGNLTHIAQFGGKGTKANSPLLDYKLLVPVVKIQKDLKSMKMANLERIVTSVWNAVNIRDENDWELENGNETCAANQYALFQKTPQNAPRSFDGLSC
ncbi:unnamed protein product [Caenorhabditis nigoni]